LTLDRNELKGDKIISSENLNIDKLEKY